MIEMYTVPMKLVEQIQSSNTQSVSCVNYRSASDPELKDNIACLTGEEKNNEMPRWKSSQG